ncbi:hypothetical protein GCM10023189_03620 [Nibrella saemangeumensis]|uniref:Secretion system C-terminal sorting domain-containing protein n=1 Tax=Nibrella saemangeumensis TaxID=1084526 RepID=A0ABP8MAC3_9BACT
MFSVVLVLFSLLEAQAQCDLTLTPVNIHTATCGANDGSFNVQVGGITAPYQYTLVKDVNGSPVVQENGTLIAGTPTFVFLTGGTYQVFIAKGGTCSGSVTVELPQQQLTMTPANLKQPTCGANDGSFNVQVGGITAPYQYTLVKDVNGSPVVQENGTLIAGTPTFVFLTGGTYQVFIAKGGTCSGSVTVELPQQQLTMTPANLKQPTCGANDGSFNVQVGGITAPYQYTLVKDVNGSPVVQENGTLIAGTPTFVFLTEGNYQVLVAKSGTCTGTTATVYLRCEAIGNEGCSPGYWKNNPNSWVTTNYSPAQTVESVFEVPDNLGLDNATLLEAVQGGGGSGVVGAAQTLLRAATTALLNAYHGDVDYPLTQAQIIAQVNAALSSGNRDTMLKLASTLDKYNNLVCPLDAKGKGKDKSKPGKPARVADVSEEAIELNLKAMPNPSAGAFTIQVDGGSGGQMTMRVTDVRGRLIEQREQLPSNQTLTFGDNYSPGIYLLEVQQSNQRKQLRLLKVSN